MAEIKNWKQLSGQDMWKNMLDPLNIDLRRYLVTYAQLTEATYDAFNLVMQSKYAGSCRYDRSEFFSKVGLDKIIPNRYNVTKYIYATSSLPVAGGFILKPLSREAWSKESNWIGYVAVATDEGKKVLGRREIVVAWRGTVQALEWAIDISATPVSANSILGSNAGDAKVHQGWLSIYTSDDPRSHYNKSSARAQVLSELIRLVEQFKNEEISITVIGHSLGAALASLHAVDIVSNGVNKPQGQRQDGSNHNGCLVTAFVLACPRVGDCNFQTFFSGLTDLRLLRIRNVPDIVPNLPLPIGYTDIGQELVIDSRTSPYLKIPGSFVTWHNLGVYMHGIAGTQGSKGGFKLEVNLDIALVNKNSDALKSKYLVPALWWIEKNMGMVQVADGSWKLMDHAGDLD